MRVCWIILLAVLSHIEGRSRSVLYSMVDRSRIFVFHEQLRMLVKRRLKRSVLSILILLQMYEEAGIDFKRRRSSVRSD